jgi:hypothetical protein
MFFSKLLYSLQTSLELDLNKISKKKRPLFLFDQRMFFYTNKNMFFLLLFLSSWAFPASLHRDGIVVQSDTIIGNEPLAEKGELSSLIYVSKGALLVDKGAVLNAAVINEVDELPEEKETKRDIVTKKNTQSHKIVSYVKKINVDVFYKNSNESFHIVKIEDNEAFTLVNYNFSGKALFLLMFLLGISTLFYTFILDRYNYNVRLCHYLFNSYRIRPPPYLWLTYS